MQSVGDSDSTTSCRNRNTVRKFSAILRIEVTLLFLASHSLTLAVGYVKVYSFKPFFFLFMSYRRRLLKVEQIVLFLNLFHDKQVETFNDVCSTHIHRCEVAFNDSQPLAQIFFTTCIINFPFPPTYYTIHV